MTFYDGAERPLRTDESKALSDFLYVRGGTPMSDFQKYLDSQMNDPEFAAEYDAMQPEYEAIRAVIAAHLEKPAAQN